MSREIPFSSSSVLEIAVIEGYASECIMHDVDANCDILLLLIRILRKKVDYYAEKYDFKIDDGDFFLVEDGVDFIRKAETDSLRASKSNDLT